MKQKIILSVIISLWFIHPVAGQTISLGVKGGINFSTISGKQSFENMEITCLQGLNYSIFLEYKLSDNFSLQSGLFYEEKGFKFKSLLFGGGYWGDFRFKYINIPVLIKLKIGGDIKYYVLAGPSTGYLINSKNTTTVCSTAEPDLLRIKYSDDVTDDFNKLSLGVMFGGGIQVPLYNNLEMILDARYNMGISKTAKEMEHGYNPQYWSKALQDSRDRTISLSLGIIYYINKHNSN
ncbi:MAG: PorT family protein [Bacteroidales bacterium]|nr:PorT family protein [Bacteroidales bacterium]